MLMQAWQPLPGFITLSGFIAKNACIHTEMQAFRSFIIRTYLMAAAFFFLSARTIFLAVAMLCFRCRFAGQT